MGAAVSLPFGEQAGVVQRVRGDVVETFCESPLDGFDPGFWNTPTEVIVDSNKRVVFISYMGSLFFSYQDFGLFRCNGSGDPAELLAVFPSRASVVDPSHLALVPFPGDSFERISGLHLARRRVVTIDDDVRHGAPQLSNEEMYGLSAMRWDPDYPNPLLELKSLRFMTTDSSWKEGPIPIDFAGDLLSPDLIHDHGDTFVAIPSAPNRNSVVRRIRGPLRLEAKGSIGNNSFSLSLDLFGGALDIGGGPTEGSLGELAGQAFVLDDRTIPNTPVCPDDGTGVSTAAPYNESLAYNTLSFGADSHIVASPDYGLVVTSNTADAGTPYLAEIDRTLLNDDPSDDKSVLFLRSELACLPQRRIALTPLLPFFDPDGAGGNGTDDLVASRFGLFGTQSQDGEVVRVVGGTKVETVVGGLNSPAGIGAYPQYVTAGAGVTILIRVDSPVDVLVTDPLGRRIGFDSNLGEAVNDFGDLGFDSGPGEPRLYAIRNPVPGGEYSLETVGNDAGPFTVHVYGFDLREPEGTHVSTSGFATFGSEDSADFVLNQNASVGFVLTSAGCEAPLDLHLEDLVVNSVVTCTAGTALSVGKNFTVVSPAALTLRAGQMVELGSGLNVLGGSIDAGIEPALRPSSRSGRTLQD